MRRTPALVLSVVAAVALVGGPSATAALSPDTTAARAQNSQPQQSPIAIRSRDAAETHLPRLRFDYPSTPVTLSYIRDDADEPGGCEHRGHEETVRATVPAGVASLTVGGIRYTLVQLHWHTPSEHVLDGRRHPIEQHLVHSAPDGSLLVVGVFVGVGGPNRELDRLFDALPAECTADVTVPAVDLNRLLPSSDVSYRYPGSLTTEPFTEGVSWVVLDQPLRATPNQLAPFLRLFPEGNTRELQPLNGRTVRTERHHH